MRTTSRWIIELIGEHGRDGLLVLPIEAFWRQQYKALRAQDMKQRDAAARATEITADRLHISKRRVQQLRKKFNGSQPGSWWRRNGKRVTARLAALRDRVAKEAAVKELLSTEEFEKLGASDAADFRLIDRLLSGAAAEKRVAELD